MSYSPSFFSALFPSHHPPLPPPTLPFPPSLPLSLPYLPPLPPLPPPSPPIPPLLLLFLCFSSSLPFLPSLPFLSFLLLLFLIHSVFSQTAVYANIQDLYQDSFSEDDSFGYGDDKIYDSIVYYQQDRVSTCSMYHLIVM